jgi:hypothetical protein
MTFESSLTHVELDKSVKSCQRIQYLWIVLALNIIINLLCFLFLDTVY